MIRVQVFSSTKKLIYEEFCADMTAAATYIDAVLLADDDATLVVTENTDD